MNIALPTLWRNKTESLLLRSCNPDLTSPHSAARGFQWPAKGKVSCPDWKPVAQGGNGLHGALWGEGCGRSFCWDEGAVWLVVAVKTSDLIALEDGVKYKFPSGRVVFSGGRFEAIAYLEKYAPGRKIIGSVRSAGDRGTASASAGDGGTASAGYRGTASAGDRGTISCLYWCQTSGRYKRLIGYVGEDGLTASTPYRVGAAGNWSPAEVEVTE